MLVPRAAQAGVASETMNHMGLGKGVCIEAHIEISFGLDIYSVNSFIETVKEVIMKNSNAILNFVLACVWCGAAFLRSLVEKTSNPSERCCVSKCIPSKRERGRFDSFPPHHFKACWHKCTLTTPSARTVMGNVSPR